jgi:hypothetical protein
MGHESRIELWSPNLTTFCFVGFGTDRLRCQEAMKTAGRENPNRWTILSSNRALGAGGQNRSCSIQWAAKQEKFRPMQGCFFLTSTFIELIRMWPRTLVLFPWTYVFLSRGMSFTALSRSTNFSSASLNIFNSRMAWACSNMWPPGGKSVPNRILSGVTSWRREATTPG